MFYISPDGGTVLNIKKALHRKRIGINGGMRTGGFLECISERSSETLYIY